MAAIKGMQAVQCRTRPFLWGLLAWFAGMVLAPSHLLYVLAYDPESPEVRSMLDRALHYIETCPKSSQAEMLGGRCLMGLAAYKYNGRFGNKDQLPRLTAEVYAKLAKESNQLAGSDNYSLGIATIFLSEVNAQQNRELIDPFLQEILQRQKSAGGWGYKAMLTCDLSQLQYATLGLWSAKHAGLTVNDDAIINVMNYVVRVQDPSGAWGYQGQDPGTFTRVAQNEIRPSLVAAGLGTLYVGGDFLGMSKGGAPRNISATAAKLPPALVPVVSSEQRRADREVSALVGSDHLQAALRDGNDWLRRLTTLETPQYQYYFLYGMERCQSFREKFEGTYEEEPEWYNKGVELLQAKQNDNGSWGTMGPFKMGENCCEPPIATSFAMLFLLRSTQETIQRVTPRDGLLRGGYGLPNDLTDVRMRDNKIVAPAVTGEVADLIQMLEDEEGEKIENLLENPDSLSLSGLEDGGKEYTDRLVRILRTGTHKTRTIAARALGRQGSLDNVPILIYALTDPDLPVRAEAEKGLRLISRRFDAPAMPDKPTPSQEAAVVGQWKEWYRSVRPDAVFIE